MSLQAMQWALQVPPKVVSAGAWRLLVHLADYADPDGDKVFPAVETMADALYCSPRTIQRHLAELQDAGLIAPGDQRYVQHLRADRRPVVWRLALHWHPEPVWDEPDEAVDKRGDSSVTPSQAVDNRAERGVSSVTPSSVDNSHGVTPAVAHGVTTVVATKDTRNEPPEEPPTRARALAAAVIHNSGHPHHANALRALADAVEGVARPGDLPGLMDLAYEAGRGDPWIGYQMLKAELERLPPRVHSLPALLRHRIES